MTDSTETPTLGEITDILKGLRERGVTLESLRYSLEKAYWKDVETEKATIAHNKATVDVLQKLNALDRAKKDLDLATSELNRITKNHESDRG